MEYANLPFNLTLSSRAFSAVESQLIYQTERPGPTVFRQGDVIEVPFPFSDLSGFKTRPALVLAISKMDLTIAFFSTHLSWVSFEDVIFLENGRNGLNSMSLLRVSKLFSIHPDMVFRKLGRIEDDELEVVRWSLKTYFGQDSWPS